MTNQIQEDLAQLADLLCIRHANGLPALMIGLSATFFFRDPWTRPAREAVADVATEYLQKFKHDLKWIRDHRSSNATIYAMSKNKVPLPKEWLPNHPDGEFWEIGLHGGESERAAADISIVAFGPERYGPPDDLGYLHFHVPLRFLIACPGEFQKMVIHAAERIRPLSGYGGIGFLQPVSNAASYDAEPLVAPLAAQFPGIEVESLISHTSWCQKGIKGVNWLTILSDHFVEQAGGYDYLRIRLPEPLFPFYKYDGGLIIQAGPHPEVGDTTRNRWPQHYVTLAKVLKKIQIKEHRPFHYGGPGRMDKAMSEAWLFRFDNK